LSSRNAILAQDPPGERKHIISRYLMTGCPYLVPHNSHWHELFTLYYLQRRPALALDLQKPYKLLAGSLLSGE
jgi:hypothetical protein